MIGRKPPPPPDEPTAPRGYDDFEVRLGDVMRGERATLGKSLLDVQRELKIKATYIAAIENADASAFETPGFIAGYVRSYARYLGLDPEWAYQTFCAESSFVNVHGMSADASRPAKREPVAASDAHDPFAQSATPFFPKGDTALATIQPGAIGSIAVLLVLIAGIGYGGWSVLTEIQRVQVAPVDQPPGVVSTLDPLAGATVAEATTSDAGLRPTSPEVLDRLYRPQALDVPVLTARDGPIANLDPSSVGSLAEDPREDVVARAAGASELPALPVEDPTPAPQVVEDGIPSVVMFAVRPAWVRVRAADGSVILEKIMEAGEQFTLPQTEEAPTLRTGAAGSVYFAINGQTYGPAGAAGQIANNVALAADALLATYTLADLEADADLATVVAELIASEVGATE